MRLFGTKKWDYYSLFGMEEKVEKYCPKYLEQRKCLKHNFTMLKKQKNRENVCPIIFGMEENNIKFIAKNICNGRSVFTTISPCY